MKKNKFTVDLGNLNLTVEERSKILDAIHKTVSRRLKLLSTNNQEAGLSKSASKKAIKALGLAGEATITAVFSTVDVGLSKLTATHNGNDKKLTKSGTITFDNVQSDDTIRIEGKSLGTTDITIDREADPQKAEFDPGTFRFTFFIK